MKEKKDILRLDDIHYQIDNQVILTPSLSRWVKASLN